MENEKLIYASAARRAILKADPSLAYVIDEVKGVDAVEVVHGYWIEKPYLFGTTRYCSICGQNYGMPHGVFKYCPNCGAVMEDKLPYEID